MIVNEILTVIQNIILSTTGDNKGVTREKMKREMKDEKWRGHNPWNPICRRIIWIRFSRKLKVFKMKT